MSCIYLLDKFLHHNNSSWGPGPTRFYIFPALCELIQIGIEGSTLLSFRVHLLQFPSLLFS